MIDLDRRLGFVVSPVVAWLRRRARTLAVGAGLLAVAIVVCLLVGLSPWLPVVLPVLVFFTVRPRYGLVYALVVLGAPLGLWAIGVQGAVGAAFGDRGYALNLSVIAVVSSHAIRAVIRWRPTRTQVLAGCSGGLILAGSAVIGIVHHGIPQTLIGIRYVVFPLVLLAVVAAQPVREIARLVGVLSWVMIANAVAAVAEFAIGPARLSSWGLAHNGAIRYIDGNFRVPGLTNFNAQLGLLAGAFLLGYLGLWLARAARPRPPHRYWHASAVAAAICLALSTSRSGAALLVAGLVGAVVLNRSGGAAGRRRSRLLGLAVLVLVTIGFVVVGATGATSLFQRFDVWGSLLRHHLPVYGLGVGAVGAASNSRFAGGPWVFVDNYYVSLALQFGPVLAVAFVGLLVAALVWLRRRSADHPEYVLYLAVVVGLAASFLVIEGWEYDSAMACVAVFVAYTLRTEPDKVA